MVFQAMGYGAALVLLICLAYRCFGLALADRSGKRRQWAIEQARLHHERVAEYERRKAAGMPVGSPPQMPLKVATMISNVSPFW